ncbi:hypothetical protein, partial [Pseudomonas sp. efr-133-TYG-103a]|uniref:hypothetical protein n=1 Tax=Pseudomonas sp. efr-133-TYG-103a TaxID=3040308 RepID=UPI002552B48B
IVKIKFQNPICESRWGFVVSGSRIRVNPTSDQHVETVACKADKKASPRARELALCSEAAF